MTTTKQYRHTKYEQNAVGKYLNTNTLLADMIDWDDWFSNYGPFGRALFNYTASTQNNASSNEWITINEIEKICKEAVVA